MYDEEPKDTFHVGDIGFDEKVVEGDPQSGKLMQNFKLSNLILEIEKIPEIKRIRYTTSHPKDMTDDLLDVYSVSKKIMPLVHLPVQSGSDKILKLMNRKHLVTDYIQTYEKTRNRDISNKGYIGTET